VCPALHDLTRDLISVERTGPGGGAEQRARRTNNMPKNPSVPELMGRIAEITSGPSRELIERVVRVLQENRNSPVEVQARAVIAAVQGIDLEQPGAPTESESASRRAAIDAAIPDFDRVVEETGILKPKP
jgi:hypothetical protein